MKHKRGIKCPLLKKFLTECVESDAESFIATCDIFDAYENEDGRGQCSWANTVSDEKKCFQPGKNECFYFEIYVSIFQIKSE